jgi:antitoxin MazE
MRTTLRKVGNSCGVLIPAAFLEGCDIGTEIEIRQEGRRIVLEPVQKERSGWFDGYQAEWEGITELPAESEEWQW